MRRRTEAQAFFFSLMSGDVAPFWRRAPAARARHVVAGRPHDLHATLPGGAPDPDGKRRECERQQEDVMRRAALRDDDLVYRMRRRSRETCADGAV